MFSEKKLKIEITLYDSKINTADGFVEYDFSKGKVLSFEDFHTDVKINKVPSICGYTASIDIYGVSQRSLNEITTISWISGEITPKRVRIWADENGKGYTNLLFEGGIMEAVPNYKSVPEVSIHIESSMLVYPNLKTVPPSSLSSDTNILDFIQSMCASYDVNCSMDEVLLSHKQDFIYKGSMDIYDSKGLGSRIDKLQRKFNKKFNFDYAFDVNGIRLVYAGGDITKTALVFTPDTYIGYPSFNNCGIVLDTEHLANINVGQRIKVQGSIVPQANDTWVINQIKYHLQTKTPKAKWIMSVRATRIKL